VTAYRKLLRRFRLDHGQSDREIKRLLAEGKRADAEREAHSIKGLAGQMGADDLCACAALLESALRKDGTTIAPLIDVFAQALAVVMQELASFCSEEPHAVFSPSTASEMLPLAERVARLLEANDPDAQTIAEELRASLSGQVRLQADTLVRRLQNDDFDGARVALRDVMTTLALGSPKESSDQSA
jgi:HPt (histidine-containing phosphotransfer) domain-containing protein